MQFPDSQKSVSVAESELLPDCADEFRERLVPHLQAWARHGIHFSISPWNSPLLIRFLCGSRGGNAAESGACVPEEYARCFTTGCLDLGPYHFPDGEALLRMKSRMPLPFGCIAVIAHDVMSYRFAYGHPDPAKRGERNPSFLDPGLMEAAIDPLVRALGSHLRAVVLHCSRIYPTEGYAFPAFLRRLDGFLAALAPKYCIAVEPGNPEYLLPEYFACLRDHGTAHVFGHRDALPPLLEQILRPDALTSDIALMRIDAEADEVVGCCGGTKMAAEVRLGIPEAVRRCLEEKKTLYIDLHDRPAGPAPLSLLAMMAMLDPDLAKLSPLRKRAA